MKEMNVEYFNEMVSKDASKRNEFETAFMQKYEEMIKEKDVNGQIKNFELEMVEHLDHIYIGKPAGFTNFVVLNFKSQSGEERQFCVYEENGKLNLYKGSRQRLLRLDKELQKRDLANYKVLAKKIVETIAKNGAVIGGIDLKQGINPPYIKPDFKTLNEIKKLNKEITELRKDPAKKEEYEATLKKKEELKKKLPVRKEDKFMATLNAIVANTDDVLIPAEEGKDAVKISDFLAKELGGKIIDDKLAYLFPDRVNFVQERINEALSEEVKDLVPDKESFDTSKDALTVIETNIKDRTGVKEPNVSALLHVFGLQKDALKLIAINGRSEDVQKIIYNDEHNALNIASCDAILEAIKANDKVDRELTYKSIAPVFAALYHANGIGKGAKQSIMKKLAQYICASRNNDIRLLMKMLDKNGIQDKGKYINEYMDLVLAGEKEKAIKSYEDHFKYNEQNVVRVEKVEDMLGFIKEKDSSKITGELLIAIMNDQFGKDNWIIKGNDVVVFEGKERLPHVIVSEKIGTIAKEINNSRNELAISAAKRIVNDGITSPQKADTLQIYIDEKENKPVIRFTEYTFDKITSSRKIWKSINFTPEQVKSIMEATKNNKDKDSSLDDILKDAEAPKKDEIENQKISYEINKLNEKWGR